MKHPVQHGTLTPTATLEQRTEWLHAHETEKRRRETVKSGNDDSATIGVVADAIAGAARRLDTSTWLAQVDRRIDAAGVSEGRRAELTSRLQRLGKGAAGPTAEGVSAELQGVIPGSYQLFAGWPWPEQVREDLVSGRAVVAVNRVHIHLRPRIEPEEGGGRKLVLYYEDEDGSSQAIRKRLLIIPSGAGADAHARVVTITIPDFVQDGKVYRVYTKDYAWRRVSSRPDDPKARYSPSYCLLSIPIQDFPPKDRTDSYGYYMRSYCFDAYPYDGREVEGEQGEEHEGEEHEGEEEIETGMLEFGGPLRIGN